MWHPDRRIHPDELNGGPEPGRMQRGHWLELQLALSHDRHDEQRQVSRAHFILMLSELQTGEHLLSQAWIGQDALKSRIVRDGCEMIGTRLSSCLAEMDGMESAW